MNFRQEISEITSGRWRLKGGSLNTTRTPGCSKEALELKLFEDQKDTIKLKNLVSSVAG